MKNGFAYYEITGVDVFKDTGLTFQEITSLTPRQRKNLGMNQEIKCTDAAIHENFDGMLDDARAPTMIDSVEDFYSRHGPK